MALLFIIAVFIFAATLLIDLHTDIQRWKVAVQTGVSTINHFRGALLRCIGLIPVVVLLGWPSILLVGSLYWFLFDGLFNYMRGFNWWFTGSEDEDDAKTDNFLQSISLANQKRIKIGLIIVSLILYIIL